ncbi:hypothetical protein J4Q44_G00296630 [Coregonus suidteri]|uniref:Uncharacterized protein n=1 Tax=Coregonus suidteri TaxID=861788 RepID=A0AAN8QC77_9TELE
MYFNRGSKKIHSEGEQLVLTPIRQEESPDHLDPELGVGLAAMRSRLTDRFDKSELESCLTQAGLAGAPHCLEFTGACTGIVAYNG